MAEASNPIAIPVDDEAERVVIGCAVDTPDGCALAHQRLTEEDFYSPRHRRLFAAAGVTPVVAREERIARIARAALVDFPDVMALVRERPVMADTTGTFAGLVAEAASRRRLMGAAAEAYNALGAGATYEEARAILEEAAQGEGESTAA